MIRLTQKEEEVMERIWNLGACTPKEVLARTAGERNPHHRTAGSKILTFGNPKPKNFIFCFVLRSLNRIFVAELDNHSLFIKHSTQ